jgi:multiple sugar transport system permease protein
MSAVTVGPRQRGGGSGTRRASAPVVVLRGMPLAPAVVLLVVFLAGPVAYCIWSAFTDMALTGAAGADFVGLENFRRAFSSPDFHLSVLLTVIFTLVSAIIGQNVLGMTLALLMRAGHRVVRTVVSAIVIGAWVVPEVVAGYLWYAFLGQGGSFNAMLGWLHLPEQNWLFTAPILAVSIANIWRGTAFSMLVYSAALSEVPREIEEAATVDGAGAWRRLFFVTLPMVRRSIATNLMLITLQTLSVFGLIWTMTRGGPNNQSTTLPIFAYQQAFQFSQLGYGTALALVLLLIGGIFSLVYLRGLRLGESMS